MSLLSLSVQNDVIGYVLTFTAVILWASTSIGYKFAIGSEGGKKRDPVMAFGFKIIIVAPFMVILAFIFSNEFHNFANIGLSYWIFGTLAAIFSVIGEVSYFYALRYIDSSRVFPLINTQTLFTFPLAFIFLNENIRVSSLISAIFMIIGVFFIKRSKDNLDKDMDKLDPNLRKLSYFRGFWFGITTGFCWAAIYVFMALQNRIYNGFIENNAIRCIISLIIVWTYILLSRKLRNKTINLFKIQKKNQNSKPKEIRDNSQISHRSYQDLKLYLLIGFFGIFSFGIADTIYQIAISLNGATISIIIASTSPLINQILARLILKEHLRKIFIVAVIFIILGNILVIF
ncbi:MAG: EamA family transporter [Promethearchaeota archaeon]